MKQYISHLVQHPSGEMYCTLFQVMLCKLYLHNAALVSVPEMALLSFYDFVICNRWKCDLFYHTVHDVHMGQIIQDWTK